MEENDVTRAQFLASKLQDFRYETSPSPDEYRLFHCASDGSCRFALYFATCYKKTDYGPYTLSVFLNCVSVPIRRITVGASMEGTKVNHYILEDGEQGMEELAKKVCQILNSHQPCFRV